ncbi:malate:quinone oxidoreductase [Kocuria sp. HSID16901]|uniref:malate:quinone oxidoreductase n=1 Tax=Kocuria sp. HSID16901 TaxID=2419505 RepID=UPI0009E50EFA|nr:MULTISPECIES: malate:quinone oxidoreductase [Kocuria]RUQ22790.1 malate:quinone oxidoreductase [Kocuria sp. HSID16901]
MTGHRPHHHAESTAQERSRVTRTHTTDVVLVGGGIMSATLGVLLKELEPNWDITVLERLDRVGAESSNAWNNAGTGHSALCELNYSPMGADGTVDPAKALNINEQFQTSRQFWTSLIEQNKLTDSSFINSVPHMSLVFGQDHSDYLAKRYKALNSQKLFERMQFTRDPEKIAEWAPLTMKGRSDDQPIAANYSPEGTDVDFGNLTRQMISHLEAEGADVRFGYQVDDLRQESDGSWSLMARNRLNTEDNVLVRAKFVFLGAGGGALPLLQKSGIPEGKGFGGFPVSGLFLRNSREETAEQHNAKVYGQASVGAPPMSVPHLDTRWVDGKRSLLFGPYAGFKTNFLKQGSYLDLFKSVKFDNLYPMTRAGLDNLGLVKYLLTELAKGEKSHVEALREYYPSADGSEWDLIEAGQRVQVMRKDAKRGGVLQFGTELITKGDGSIAALLGASPGASTAVPIMLNLVKKCFPDHVDGWAPRIKELVPAYGHRLNDEPELADEIMAHTAKVLGIKN